MYEPEENKAEVGADENSVNTQSSSEASEYSFRKEEIYSDAHYEPAGTSTKPPRYYTPPERPVKEPKPKKQKSKSVWPAAFLHAAHNNFDQAVFGVITRGEDKMYFVSETGCLTILCAWIMAVIILIMIRKDADQKVFD